VDEELSTLLLTQGREALEIFNEQETSAFIYKGHLRGKGATNGL